MQRITSASSIALHDIAATRRVEYALATTLPPHTLMQRAGLATARLAMAIAPHARQVWVACGPGNNGGDGFEAALQLHLRGFNPVLTFVGEPGRLPEDASASFQRAMAAGIPLSSAAPMHFDLAIDALLGIGSKRAPEGAMADQLRHMNRSGSPVLCVDVPTGLNADTGAFISDSVDRHACETQATRRYCLSLLTLKPGLFTAMGRDRAGEVWLDDLGAGATTEAPTARLIGSAPSNWRAHASHKGSFGDVMVIGGASGMAGAALLAGSAALHDGAGRVYVGLLDGTAAPVDLSQPELMLRAPSLLDFARAAVVCGCGGGSAIRAELPRAISSAAALVLDADALNAIALDTDLQRQVQARVQRGQPTVLTPHPLEAARLLNLSVAQVQANRLAAAKQLSERYGVVVLKGSGTVIAGANEEPVINASGNGRLASAGTGDVLAGLIGATLAAGHAPFAAARRSVWHHGDLADRWPAGKALSASALARGLV